MDVKTWVYIFFFIFLGIVLFPLESRSAEEVKEENIEVTLGIDKVIEIDFPFSSKLQIGNTSLLNVDIVPQKREIILKGLKAGKTSVTVRNTVGDIKKRLIVNITATSLSKTVQELREFLDDVEGLKIEIKGGKVVVGGELVVPTDIGKVAVVLSLYDDVVRLIKLSPHSQRIISRKMQDEIQKNGMKQVTVRVVNDVFWLEGVVGSTAERNLALKIAEGYLPDKLKSLSSQAAEFQGVKGKSPVQSFIVVNAKSSPPPQPKLVKVITQFVELSKDYGRIFGFKWEPLLSEGQGAISFGRTASGDIRTQSNNQTLSGTISNLLPKLNSAKNAGYARIIQSGMLVIKNATKGNLRKNTTQPFSVGTGEFQQASSATTGLTIDVTPTILADEMVEMAVGVGVNVSAGSIGGNPVTTSNNISTTVVVKSKDSAAIGGVVFNQSRTDYDKPSQQTDTTGGTGTPPSPLFSFLRSKDYTSNKTQFVVFLTPEVLESASAGTSEIKQKFRRRAR